MDAKALLRQLDISPRKYRGQNFLEDDLAIRQILSFAQMRDEDVVCEIGPGLGVLTNHIAQRVSRFVVVDLEEAFCAHLERSVSQLEPSSIVCADILKLSAESIADLLGQESFSIISNVPYSISSELVLWILRNRAQIKSASLLLQREFAERIAAEPGSRAYGSLSVLTAVYAEASLGDVFEGSVFYPATKVESRLLRLNILDQPRIQLSDPQYFEQVVRASFSHRRKTLVNSLSASGLFEAKQDVVQVLSAAEIEPRRRAETLTIEDFARLTDCAVKVHAR